MKRTPFKRKVSKLARKSKKRSPKMIARDKAWVTFSRWIRKVRDKDICYTCGIKSEVSNSGHFWHNVLDFDEENIHCQCIRCNHRLSGNLAVYAHRLLSELGEERFKALEIRKSMAQRGEMHDLQFYLDIIQKYE